ncbi:MAG: response regulator [Candidatus Latescibacteria bacterium]|nr:response regulator [Candidatus Latescibacterota bacterium]
MARILVVDDEKTFCDYFARYLATQGFTVEHVYDGREALTRLQQGTFDAVISDRRMPGTDGLELLRVVKTWRPSAHTFLMAAFDAPPGIETDLSGMFNKPFKFREVVMTLRSILQRIPHLDGVPACSIEKEVKEYE